MTAPIMSSSVDLFSRDDKVTLLCMLASLASVAHVPCAASWPVRGPSDRHTGSEGEKALSRPACMQGAAT
jgi:hypothetical protein